MSDGWRPTVQKQLTQAEIQFLTRALAVAVLIGDAVKTDMPRAVPALADASNGIGSSFSSGGVAGGERPDPTFSAVVARLDGGMDRSAVDLDTLRRGVPQFLALARELRGVIERNLDSPTPVTSKCVNVHGCPTDSWPTPGRGGRCKTCATYYDRHDHQDRTQVHRQVKAEDAAA